MPKTQPFDDHYEEYDEWFVKNQTIYEAEIAAIRSFLPRFSRGLEIGVGTGKFSVPLGIDTGIDPSFSMALRSKNLGMNILLAVAESLPFRNNSFDFILIVTSVCFFDNVQLALREAGRVLESDGHIIIGFVDVDSSLGREYASKKEKSKFYRPATFYSTQNITDCLAEAGFTGFEYRQTIFPYGFSSGIYKPGYGEGGFIAVKAVKPGKR